MIKGVMRALTGAAIGVVLSAAVVLAEGEGPKLAFHVDQDDQATMNMALNNAVISSRIIRNLARLQRSRS